MKRAILIVAILALSAYCALWALVDMGLRHNDTSSVPVGWYWYTPGPVYRGQLVQACLPINLATFALDRGIARIGSVCPGGVAPMVKVLAAVYPDVVTVRDDAVLIDGKPWPLSATPTHDKSGRPVPFRMKPGTYHVGPFQVLLLGLSLRSWDGKIYGLMPRAIVTGTWTRVPWPFSLIP